MNIANLIGFLLPPAIDLINAKIENETIRFWVAMIICFAAGILLNLDKISNLDELLGNAAIVFTAAQLTYNTYWKKAPERQNLLKAVNK